MSEQITPNPSVPSQVVAEVTFPKFINNLGIIPTSYKDSMSYYECLAWLCKYLEETVIPTVNQNGQAVEELQNLYIELNSYVTNYFDNLDVQQEINNKLDAMTESGELTNIIKNYVDPIYEAYESEINTRISSQDSEISILTARMDEFSTLTEGSTTGDAELADIRIAFTGDTYANAGDSVRAQSELLYEDLGKTYLKRLIISMFPNSGCIYNGEITENVHYKYSNPILMKKGQRLYFRTWADGLNVWTITKSNISGEIVEILEKGGNANYRETTMDFSSDTYIILCINIDNTHEWNGYIINYENEKNLLNLEQIQEKFKFQIINYFDKAYSAKENTTIDVSGNEYSSSGKTLYEFYVTGGETLYFSETCATIQGIAFYNSMNQFLGNIYTLGLTHWNDTLQIPDTAYKCKATYGGDTYEKYIGKQENYGLFKAGYKTKINNDTFINPNNEYLEIGVGTSFPKLNDGFNVARACNLGVIIKPGTYDLVNDGGYTLTGTGMYAPKKIIGYGAKIICELANENWDFSVLNIDPTYPETIIEGLEIECENCRYCIHDEEYNNANYYHNVYKNLKLTHKSEASATLIRPICIGGGLGNVADIEINNCFLSSKDNYNGRHEDINYHSNGTGVQTGSCTIICKDCIFENGIGGSSYGASTDFMNMLYVSNCLSDREIPSRTLTNFTTICYNNVVNE